MNSIQYVGTRVHLWSKKNDSFTQDNCLMIKYALHTITIFNLSFLHLYANPYGNEWMEEEFTLSHTRVHLWVKKTTNQGGVYSIWMQQG